MPSHCSDIIAQKFSNEKPGFWREALKIKALRVCKKIVDKWIRFYVNKLLPVINRIFSAYLKKDTGHVM